MKNFSLTIALLFTFGTAVSSEQTNDSFQLAKPTLTPLESLNRSANKADSCSTACATAFHECRKYQPLNVCLPSLSRCLIFCP